MKNKLFNKKNFYYATTLFIAFFVGLIGGIIDILHTNAVIEVAQRLQYPLYFFTLLGIFKILGAIALVLPQKFSKIKEWAYAGFTFDFIYASYSHFSVGDTIGKIIFPLVLIMILATSYYLKDRLN